MKKFINHLQSKGIYFFDKKKAKEYLKVSDIALKNQLIRYSKKNSIVRIKSDFYIILPVEYQNAGILPPFWFIDALMNHFNISYYVGLVSAAAHYGAAHQQPQAFQVVVNKKISDINVKGLRIHLFLKSKISTENIINKKSETGYVKVSNPNLTVIDLLKYVKKIGGLSNAATVISELIPEINVDNLIDVANKENAEIYLRRLGYILESVIHEKNISSKLYEKLIQSDYSALLDPSLSMKGSKYDKKWKLYINSKIEMDEI